MSRQGQVSVQTAGYSICYMACISPNKAARRLPLSNIGHAASHAHYCQHSRHTVHTARLIVTASSGVIRYEQLAYQNAWNQQDNSHLPELLSNYRITVIYRLNNGFKILTKTVRKTTVIFPTLSSLHIDSLNADLFSLLVTSPR